MEVKRGRKGKKLDTQSFTLDASDEWTRVITKASPRAQRAALLEEGL